MSGNNLKIAACTPVVHPGEVGANLEAVSSMIREAALCGAQLIVFPCNCLAGASCGEDILRFGFIESAVFDARREISALAAGLGVTVALDECLYAGYVSVIPAAEPELVTAQAKRREALREFSRGRVVVWCNAGYGESTTDFVYGGGSMIWADGECLAENPRFGTGGAIIYAEVGFGAQGGCCSPLKTSATPTPPGGPLPLMVPRVAQFSEGTAAPLCAPNPHPFVPEDAEELARRCEEVFDIQTVGLMTRMEHIGCRNAVIGISGGLDSTLALLVSCRAFDTLGFDRKGILAVTMPGFGTTGRTKGNAVALMEALGVSIREISIEASVRQHLSDIGHPIEKTDVTYENAQARERTQILMDLANDCGGIVVGTGDLSELALGWCTYNGDHMSMYAVNAGVPKTMMQAMVRHAAGNGFPEAAGTLLDIVATPISPELLPGVQPTEDIVGPYELHDFFLYRLVRLNESPSEIRDAALKAFAGVYEGAVVDRWLRKFLWRFFSQQFKRSCSPDGPAVGSVSLSPRQGFRFASDISAAPWVADLDRKTNDQSI